MRRRRAVLVILGLALAAAGGAGCARHDDRETEEGAQGAADPVQSTVAGSRHELRTAAHDGASLIQALGCGGCHAGVPAPARPIAGRLAEHDRARDLSATFAYLRDSPRAAAGAAHTPSFHLDDAEALALSLYVAGGAAGGGSARRRLDVARQAHGGVEAEDGARIFRALNCAACHEHGGVEPRKNGPPLAGAASRLRPAALRDFLRRPHAVRPFGFEPGSGGRMPDFVLSDSEADSIAAYLGTLGVRFEPYESSLPDSLSAFATAKARALLEKRLSCLGCHALNGEGGRIGPDLGHAGARVASAYIAVVIDDPQRAMPGTIMPRSALPQATRDLIIAFLASGGDATAADANGEGDRSVEAGEGGETRASFEDTTEIERAGYPSFIDHPITYPPAPGVTGAGQPSNAVTDPVARTYAAQCAMCHGPDGRGDGYNARYLRARPAVHASSDAMSRRPDDTLFDGIHSGGAILGGSPEMPAFGESLSPRQIMGLVDYIRKLCDCRQPAWAEDGGR